MFLLYCGQKNLTTTIGDMGYLGTLTTAGKKQYEDRGEQALVNTKPCPENLKIRLAKDVEEKILYIRR